MSEERVEKRQRPRGGRRPHRKVCSFCVDKIEYIDYKDAQYLYRFVNDQGKILPRRLTGTSLKYQKKVAQAIKRARHIAIMPYVGDNLRENK